MYPVLLTTPRLILRKFRQEDLEDLYLLLHDQEVNTFLPWFPVKNLAQTQAFLEERFNPDEPYAYAICQKSDNRAIGYIKVAKEESHDLGYGLRREYWHQGIVTEAGRAVVEQAKQDGLAYLTATHDVNNPRSGGVMKQIGMTYRYTYQELWQPKNHLVTFRLYQCNLDGHDSRVYRKYWEESAVHWIEKEV